MTTLEPVPGIFRGQRGSKLLRAGLVLGVLAVVILGLGLAGAGMLEAEVARRAAERTGDSIDLDDLRAVTTLLAVGSILPVILICAAIAVIIPGEMMRRGGWATRTTTLWRGGTNAMVYRTLPVRVHAVWTVVALVFVLLIVVVPGATAAMLGWPDYRDSITWSYLRFTGIPVTAIAVVLIVTLVKKAFWERAGRPDIETVGAGGAQRFWRGLTYRWKVDIWFAIFGGLGLGMSLFEAYLDSTEYWPSTLAVSSALVVVGAVFAANFWRSGEDLGTQESFS